MKNTYPIVILDDDAAILKALQETLKIEGYFCFGTTRVYDALEFIKKQTVAVVLSDQRMTEIKGTCFLQQVKSLQPTCSRVLITGVLVSDMFLEAINSAEIFRCLAKPWTRAQLLKIIEESYSHFEKNLSVETSYKALLEINQKLVDENATLRAKKQNL